VRVWWSASKKPKRRGRKGAGVRTARKCRERTEKMTWHQKKKRGATRLLLVIWARMLSGPTCRWPRRLALRRGPFLRCAHPQTVGPERGGRKGLAATRHRVRRLINGHAVRWDLVSVALHSLILYHYNKSCHFIIRRETY
jgi:hypothetical protein